MGSLVRVQYRPPEDPNVSFGSFSVLEKRAVMRWLVLIGIYAGHCNDGPVLDDKIDEKRRADKRLSESGRLLEKSAVGERICLEWPENAMFFPADDLRRWTSGPLDGSVPRALAPMHGRESGKPRQTASESADYE